MFHFLYLITFAFFTAIVFAIVSTGNFKEKTIAGFKAFAEFLGVAFVLAWVFYFLPW